MIAFLRWLKGYYCISIRGYSPERFFNLCKINGYILWGIVPLRQGGYLFCIHRKEYKDILPFTKKTKTDTEIKDQKGLPFIIKNNKKRYPFFIGIIGCLLSLYLLSYFIWSFEIYGNEKIEPQLIVRLLKDEGIHYGSYKKTIDIQKIEELLREYFHNISWVSVKIEGIKLIISLKEGIELKTEDISSSTTAKHIYAELDGELLKIVTRAGTPKVKAGDQVTAGQILIEGYIPIYDDAGTLLRSNEVEADGDYCIRSSLNFSKEISRYYKYKYYTQNEKSVYYIRFGRHYFCFQLFGKNFLLYEIKEKESQPTIFKKLNIPIYFGKRRYIEYTVREDLYEEDEAKILLNRSIEMLVKDLNEKGVQIIQKNVKIDVGDKQISLVGEFVIDVTREYK